MEKSNDEILKEAKEVLSGYEDFEAELISDNRCWEPEGMANNPRLTNELWEKLMILQSKRNSILHPGKYS